MNWVGGSRARAKAKEQLKNKMRNNVPNRLNQEEPEVVEIVELSDDENEEGQGNVAVGESASNANTGPSQPLRLEKVVPTRSGFPRKVDYAGLGYKLANPEPRPREVPLLNYLKENFPNGSGALMATHLDFVMGITRPIPPGRPVPPPMQFPPRPRAPIAPLVLSNTRTSRSTINSTITISSSSDESNGTPQTTLVSSDCSSLPPNLPSSSNLASSEYSSLPPNLPSSSNSNSSKNDASHASNNRSRYFT